MISLYESILKNTKVGKAFVGEHVKEFIKNTYDYKHYFNNCEVKVEPKGAYWGIDLVGHANKSGAFVFTKADTENASGILPYKFYCIKINGHTTNITYQDMKFNNPDEFVQEVEYFIHFTGCNIDVLDRLPKGCKELGFSYGHRLGGGSPCVVNEIKNIKVDEFTLNEYGNGGLACRLDNIKGIDVKNKMCICDEMLGYYSIEKGGSKFKEDVSQMLSRFFKNNKVDYRDCLFMPSRNNTTKAGKGKIHFDEKIGVWRFKGEK